MSAGVSAAIVPSYIAKVGRAKKHLVELEETIDFYASTKPYTASETIEGKRKSRTWRLVFTREPADTDIPIIVADVVYNLRSSLDHLMCALVAKQDRRSAMFPVYFQDVWEPSPPGEDEQRRKSRQRWASDTKSLGPEALAFLKLAQPPNDGGHDNEDANLLRVLNGWSNRDRHQKLPIVAPGLQGMMVKITRGDGKVQPGFATSKHEDPFFKSGSKLEGVPDDATSVEIAGVPAIAIGVGGTEHYVGIPHHLTLTVALIEKEIIPKLSPYTRAS